MEQLESKEYSWKWITASELLSHGACELCHAILCCHGNPCYVDIYDGENNTGKFLVRLKALENRSVSVDLHHHAYCRRGLYVYCSGDVEGIFVQWLERPQGIGYP